MKKLLVTVFLVGFLVLPASAQVSKEEEARYVASCAKSFNVPIKEAENIVISGEVFKVILKNQKYPAFSECYRWSVFKE